MRNVITSAVALTLIAAGSANANSVYNRYETRNEHGRSNLQVESIRTEAGVEIDRDLSIKMLSDAGDINTADISFDGSSFTGSAHSSNRRPVDPIVKGTFTETLTNTAFTELTKTSFTENVNFDAHIYEHETGNR